LGEVTIQAYCVLDAYINGFAFQEKTVSFKTAEEAAVLARLHRGARGAAAGGVDRH